jgi:hypothetical protein
LVGGNSLKPRIGSKFYKVYFAGQNLRLLRFDPINLYLASRASLRKKVGDSDVELLCDAFFWPALKGN